MSDIVLSIIGGSAGATLIAGIFTLLQWLLNRKAQKEDRAADKKIADCTVRGQEIAAVRKLVDALYSANRILMYDRIKHLAKVYISREEITAEELEDLISMHECYHTDLGGNGFLDDLMAQVRHLPIVTARGHR